MMRLFCACLLVSACLSCVGQTAPSTPNRPATTPQHLDTIAHDEKIYRLHKRFSDLDLEMPKTWEFAQLQAFADVIHQWAMKTAQTPRSEWHSVGNETYLAWWDRVLRSQSLQMEMIQQPKAIDLYSATALSNQPGRNPDNWLFKASITGDASQWFATPSDVHDQASVLQAAGIDLSTDVNGEALCSKVVNTDTISVDKNKNPFQKCLLRLGGKDVIGRIVGASKGTLSWSQNPSVFDGAIVPTTYSLDNQTFAGEADYDPSKLFLTGTDWNSAYGAAALYGDQHEEYFVRLIADKCHVYLPAGPLSVQSRQRLISDKCIETLAVAHGFWARLGQTLVPTAKFVEKTNLDFVANTGVVGITPYPSKRLGDLTLTVDLTRLIPSAKAKQDALTALSTIATKAKPGAKNKLDQLVRWWADHPEKMDSDEDALFNKLLAAIAAVQADGE